MANDDGYDIETSSSNSKVWLYFKNNKEVFITMASTLSYRFQEEKTAVPNLA